MSLLVVGSVALDTVDTPFGQAKEVLGGSAVYFSVAASFFSDVKLVAVVGDDFPPEHIEFLKNKGVDVEGLQQEKGKTFRWRGSYSNNLNEANTLETQLNVFEEFSPSLPEQYQDAEHVFLANIDPQLQDQVLEQVSSPKFIALDTMNFWIEGKYEALQAVIEQVDLCVINEAEARQYSREPNLLRAARNILSQGPHTVIVKKGEHGAVMFTDHSIFVAPAYPLESVFDPTGAGDSFAGGIMGYLSKVGEIKEEYIRQAMIFGSVMASFAVEDFSLNRLRNLDFQDIENRFREFKSLTHFEDISPLLD